MHIAQYPADDAAVARADERRLQPEATPITAMMGLFQLPQRRPMTDHDRAVLRLVEAAQALEVLRNDPAGHLAKAIVGMQDVQAHMDLYLTEWSGS